MISLFSLVKCDHGGPDGRGKPPLAKNDPADSGNGSSSTNPGSPNSSNPNLPGSKGGMDGKGSKGTNGSNPSQAGSPSATQPKGSFRTGVETPVAVVGTLANEVLKKDFAAFMKLAGENAIGVKDKERLKELIENPDMRLDPDRPFWEVAKTKDAVRWVMNFVPVPGKKGEPTSITLDLNRISDTEFKIARVGFSPSLKEVVAAIQKPGEATITLDSLTVAQAFSNAVLSEDFASARKLSSKVVTDERIAGLMIALEEGKFKMREERPLIVTLSRDDVTWVLSRVNSPDQTSEFALELEKTGNWMVNGLTFGKVIASLAKGNSGPYSPIVEDPTGGESLVVYFDFDEAGLTSRADNQLRIVANILRQDEKRQIRITGHADALGSDNYNRELSSNRAESIRQAIISRGAAPDQVITEGYGSTRPRKPNFKEDGSDNPTGRTENRRAEVYLDF